MDCPGCRTPAEAPTARVALLLGLFLALAPSLAVAERIDLTEYVVPEPLAGDWKVLALEGGAERRFDVLSVSPWKKNGYHVVSTVMETDLPVATGAQAVVPGKKLLVEAVSAGELALIFSRPRRQMKLSLEPGRIERFKMAGRALLSGQDIGRGKFFGTYQLVGFEDVDAGGTSFPMAARLSFAATLQIKGANGSVVEVREQLTFWYAEGVGLVAGDETLSLFVNGVPMETVGPREFSVVDGVWGGEEIFPGP